MVSHSSSLDAFEQCRELRIAIGDLEYWSFARECSTMFERDRYEKIPDHRARGRHAADSGDARLRAGSHPGARHVRVLSS